eukprot:5819599-Ditylum_brightwellii.AAC.1
MDLKKNESKIVVPTDKTNGHRLVAIEHYIKWANGHMQEAAIPIRRTDIVKLHHDAMDFALALKELLNGDELGYSLENLNSRAIPEPQLLIKDHKKKKNGHYPTRLVIPATNFAATFSQIGYLGLKEIFDDNGVRYNKYTIQQASDLK